MLTWYFRRWRQRRHGRGQSRYRAWPRGNWTFFCSDSGGKTAAVLRSFVASCKRCDVEPFAWFNDVLSRIPAHSITRLTELLPHNWQPASSPAEALKFAVAGVSLKILA